MRDAILSPEVSPVMINIFLDNLYRNNKKIIFFN
jgi:hypothetical protein